MILIGLIAAPCLGGVQAFAVVDGQLLAGQRTAKVESSQSSGAAAFETRDRTFAGHVNILSNVRFGGFLTSREFVNASAGHSMGQWTGTLFGPEIVGTLWVQRIGIYGKAALVYGNYLHTGVLQVESESAESHEMQSFDVTYDVFGTRSSIGTKWYPFTTVALLAEYAFSYETAERQSPSTVLPGSARGDLIDPELVRAHGLLLGIEMGI